MILGRFGNTSSAPYVRALIRVPKLGIEQFVSFLLDTGATNTIIMPRDFKLMRLNARRLGTAKKSACMGGTSKYYEVPAEVFFQGEDDVIYEYRIDICIHAYEARLETYESLLGRDIISNWKLDCDLVDKTLKIEPKRFHLAHEPSN